MSTRKERLDSIAEGVTGVVWSFHDNADIVIVVIHGLGDHAEYQENDIVQACLQKGRAIVAVDLPGHGRSKGTRGHIDDWQRYIDATDATIQYAMSRFKNAEIILYGNSAGGLVVLNFAVKRSDIAAVYASAPMLSLPVNGVVKQLIRFTGYIAPNYPLVLDPKAKPPRHGYCTLGWLSAAQTACNAFAASSLEARTPLTLCIGTNDHIVPLSDVEALATKLKAKLNIYHGSGHEPFASRRDPNYKKYLADFTALVDEVHQQSILNTERHASTPSADIDQETIIDNSPTKSPPRLGADLLADFSSSARAVV